MPHHTQACAQQEVEPEARVEHHGDTMGSTASITEGGVQEANQVHHLGQDSKHGATSDWPACAVDGNIHSEACKKRFANIFDKEDEMQAPAAAKHAASVEGHAKAGEAVEGQAQKEVVAPQPAAMEVVTPQLAGTGVVTPQPAAMEMGSSQPASMEVEAPPPAAKRSDEAELPESKRLRKIAALTVFTA